MTNPGKTDLVAWWAFDEGNYDNAADSHTNSYTLGRTSVTIEPVAGLVNGARQLAASGTKYFSKDDHTPFSPGDADITTGGWVKHDIVSSTTTPLCMSSVWYTAGGLRSWAIFQMSSQYVFYVSGDGSASTTVSTSLAGGIQTGTWYFIACYHDAINNKIGIRINDTTTEANHTTGIYNTASASPYFMVGAYATGAGITSASVDEHFYYNKKLSSDNLDWLYNSGSGRSYADLSLTGKVLSPMWFM